MPDRTRLAERVGLDEDERAVVYYTALLVNVGCHTDAHEQAKWFGDDIALKSGKYDHEPRSLRAAAAAMRQLGAGNPPLHRFRVGLEFALSGHREVDGHDRPARAHRADAGASSSGCPTRCSRRSAPPYEQWDGRGWPGELEGEAIPIASRIAQLAEFVEVAHRVGGVERRATPSPASGAAGSSTRRSRRSSCADAELLLADLDAIGTWDAVIDAEPALGGRAHAATQFDAALLGDRRLRRPQVALHPRPRARRRGARGRGRRAARARRDEVTTLRRAGLVHDFGRLGVSNAIWDKRGPLGAGEWERVRLQPYLTERMLQQSAALAPLGAHRGRSTASASTARAIRAGSSGARDLARRRGSSAAADAYQAMREPRPHRPARSADEARGRAARRGPRPAGSTRRPSRRCSARPATASPRRREGPAGLTAREVEVLRLLARGHVEQGDRRSGS